MKLLAVVISIAIAAPLSAQTPAEITARAVKLHGGAALAKMKYAMQSAKGKFNFGGVDVQATRDAKWALPDRAMWTLDFSRDGTKMRTKIALTGLSGWQQVNANPAGDMSPPAYDTISEETWLTWLCTVAPLAGKGLTLAAEDVVQVDGQPAIGVIVSRAGKPDVTLYFSKLTGLLVKAKFRGHEGGKLVMKEYVFAAHKEVNDVMVPMKQTDWVNGTRMGEWQITEWKFADKFGPDEFKKP